MNRYRFSVRPSSLLGYTDVAHVEDGEDAFDCIRRQAIYTLGTSIDLTLGGTKMFLAAWEDPDHWSTDWAEVLGIDIDEVNDAVAALIEAAKEGG